MKKCELKAETITDNRAQRVTCLRNRKGAAVAYVVTDKAKVRAAAGGR